MSTEKHAPEPWHVQDNTDEPHGQLLVDSWRDGAVAICGTAENVPGVDRELHGNARRICACVNACAGIPTEALEQGVVAEALEALDNVTASLESCLAHFGQYMPEADRVNRERIAAQARALVDSILRPGR